MVIIEADQEDVEAILELQRLAYVTEAELYDDYTIAPLEETLDQLRLDFGSHVFLKAVIDDKIVGSVRADMSGGVCRIGRLIVHPDFRSGGIGTRLMVEIESRFPDAARYELFTGYRSVNNIRLYERLGYREFRRDRVNDKLTFVFMCKP